MPVDKKGQSLKVGDPVILRGVITQLGPNDMFSNVCVETAPGPAKQTFHVHGAYLELEPRTEPKAAPPTPPRPPAAPGPPPPTGSATPGAPVPPTAT